MKYCCCCATFKLLIFKNKATPWFVKKHVRLIIYRAAEYFFSIFHYNYLQSCNVCILFLIFELASRLISSFHSSSSCHLRRSWVETRVTTLIKAKLHKSNESNEHWQIWSGCSLNVTANIIKAKVWFITSLIILKMHNSFEFKYRNALLNVNLHKNHHFKNRKIVK